MLAKNNSDMEDTIVTLHELTDDEKIKLQCEARERYQWDMASAIAKGKQEGLREVVLIVNALREGKSEQELRTQYGDEAINAAKSIL